MIGAVIGVLGRLIVPGRQHIGVLSTVLIGIVAAFVGAVIAHALHVDHTKGVDWIEWIIQIGLAALGGGRAGPLQVPALTHADGVGCAQESLPS
ncbi:hypothetical protein GCM10020000_26530 [Streptomyces olivoverticillatus]